MKTIIQGIASGVLALVSATAICQSYTEIPYKQDYADKYELAGEGERTGEGEQTRLLQVRSDRNKNVQILTDDGLLQAWEKYLVPDQRYRPLSDRHIVALDTYKDQFVYLTDKAVLSNAWAGKFHVEHQAIEPTHFVMGDDFSFLLATKEKLVFFEKGKKSWEKELKGFEPLELLYDANRQLYIVLSENAIHSFQCTDRKLRRKFTGTQLTAISFSADRQQLLVGSEKGILTLDPVSCKEILPLNSRLPDPVITSIKLIHGRLWIGSSRGAFALREDGKYDYYASGRWLVDDRVTDMAAGPDQSVLILTEKGMSRINFQNMILEEKAGHFQEIQRLRHIRYGFSSEGYLSRPGDPSSLVLSDSDNDGLWTSMYLAGELFRYAVSGSGNALQNAYEAFEAMERLTEISAIPGFPARTYEMDGYQSSDTDPDIPEDQKIWRLSEDGQWRWKSTTSSDESCGHFFVYALFAEMVPDPSWRERAVHQIKIEMDHIIDNDWYLRTWNGEITRWGRWNPDYVNSFPVNVGDRRLNSTLIVAFLQTAYHFTGEEIYKEKAYELMYKHGYLENILRPAHVIGHVEGEMLSDSWNHSDDEMYFLTVPALVRYAFTEELRQDYLKTVQSHWEIERSEKNPLWNFLYALAGGSDMDLEESIWWLREFPMDLISWTVENSHRKDLIRVEPNFRKQEYTKVLPRDERPMHLHNNAYRNNGGNDGRIEYPPYIFLLPYWVGRYVEAIKPAG
ncbi:MAG: hypothetical protein ABFS28_07570 [Bacteroidota bacterium]